MKSRKTRTAKRNAETASASAQAPAAYDEDDDNDPVWISVIRLAKDVQGDWRRCGCRACKRAKACRGARIQCSDLQPRYQPANDPQKAARDEARHMAILQRMLRERLKAIGAEDD